MKKIILLSVVIYFTCLCGLHAQVINPIPSFAFPITTHQTVFGELKASNGKEKRDMDVEISTASHGSTPISATVWVVKKNGNTVRGPFTIYPGDLLSVPIDNGKWGVIVNCDWSVLVNVWVD